MTNDNYTLSVSKFNNIVKNIFMNEELLHNIKIVGEVFGVSYTKTAVYFSIKDADSSLPCICFSPEIMSKILEGDEVVVTGSPNFYTKSGRFNFIVSKIEHSGQGALFQKFMELKQKLESEGLFDQANKKMLPQSIKRIGVVTSKDGAVLQDIKNVTWRRNPSIDIVLFDTKVQGIGAENEIAAGIDFFSNYDAVDVVIVARGGGSLEDLSAYNTETVARATYHCNKPIVSAVGHETDFTIIDFVSDVRAPTPSAAAEILTKDTQNLTLAFKKDITRLKRNLETYLADKQMELAGSKNAFLSLFEDYVSDKKQKCQKLCQKIAANLENFVKNADFNLKIKLTKLSKLNPLDILRLGYAKIEQQGKSIGKLAELDIHRPIEINFNDGRIDIVPKESK